jgi:hypothetical protein
MRITSAERTYEANLHSSNRERRLGGKQDLSFQRVSWPKGPGLCPTYTALKNLDIQLNVFRVSQIACHRTKHMRSWSKEEVLSEMVENFGVWGLVVGRSIDISNIPDQDTRESGDGAGMPERRPKIATRVSRCCCAAKEIKSGFLESPITALSTAPPLSDFPTRALNRNVDVA